MKNLSILFDRSKLFWEKGFLDLIFPMRCVDCGKEGSFVCYDCAQKIENIETMTCAFCGKISKSGQFCSGCKTKWGMELSGLIVAARYDAGPTKEMIHHLKYSGFTELAASLSEIVYQSLRKNMPKGDFVAVPVPLHKNREAIRGFNQSELIVRDLSKKLHLHGGCAISRVKDTETQVNLNRELRQQNLKGAFTCSDSTLVKGKNILLIDDVATTLTTLNECAKVLKDAGAKKIWGVVVARRM
jgi:ComF family protein